MARTGQVDTFYAGNRRTLRFTVYDDDNPGSALSLVGLTAKFALSALNADGTYDLTPVLQKVTGSGITVTDAANGKLEVALSNVDTAALVGDYYFELELFDGDGVGLVVATGVITVRRNVANT